MTLELTAEEIVTDLLSSHEILKRKRLNFYVSDQLNLGEYLKNLPQEELLEEQKVEEEDSKYTFIKNNWVI